MRRPLISCTLLMAMGIFFSEQLNPYILWLMSAGLVVMAGAYLLRGLSLRSLAGFGCGLLCFLVGVFSYQIKEASVHRLYAYEGGQLIQGRVISVDQYSTVVDRVEITSELTGIRLRAEVDKILVKHMWKTDIYWEPGDLVQLQGTVNRFEGARNPGTFSAYKYYNSLGIPLFTKQESAIVLLGKDRGFKTATAQLKERVKTLTGNMLDEEDAHLLQGILLGDDGALDQDVKNAFRMSGIAHVLAVSGLHFGILYLLIYKSLQKLRLPFKMSLGLILPLLLIFVMVTGASFSAVRAFTMVVLHQVSIVCRKKYDLLNALGAISLATLLVNPFMAWNVGFQLSFWAVFVIGIYGHWRKRLGKYRAYELILFPMAVQVGLTPIMVFHFNRLHIYSLLFNIPVGLLMPPVFISGLLALLLWNIPFLGPLLTVFSGALLTSLRELAMLVERLPLNSIAVGAPSAISLLALYTLGAVFFLSLEFRHNLKWCFYEHKKVAIGLCISVFLLWSLPNTQQIGVDFLDVGQGDSILIHGKDGGHILIDSGPEKADLKDILLKQGITHLDAVFLSHPDADHAFGFTEISDSIRVDTFYHGKIVEKEEVLKELKTLYKDTEFIELDRGDCLRWQGVDLQAIYPSGTIDLSEGSLSANNLSLTLLASIGDHKLLFTGDIEKEAEEDILNSYGANLPKVDILKVAHHGSNTSSTKAFVEAIDPDIAVIQVGQNFFGHPTDKTLSTLYETGAAVYRNDRQGCIRMLFENEDIIIEPWLTSVH